MKDLLKQLIEKHKFILSLFFVSLIGGGILFFGISLSVIAMVDGQLIWKKDFNETVDLMAKYYDTAGGHHDATGLAESEILKDEDLMKRIKKEALSRMIEYKILVVGLEKMNPDWGKSAEAKIEEAMKNIKENDKFNEGVKALYGMDQASFKGKVLIPQAQFEILSEGLKKQGKNYDQWIKEKKEKASVRIMIDGLEWGDGEVQIVQN